MQQQDDRFNDHSTKPGRDSRTDGKNCHISIMLMPSKVGWLPFLPLTFRVII